MEDDFDIYQDLPPICDIKDNGASSENNENISKECEELKKEVTELTSKLQKLQKINETLEVNLSSLLKTAKAEISRKDKMIDELRRQVDDMSFKRGYFSKNKREIHNKPVQQTPSPNTEELNNVQPECTTNLTTENVALIKTISNDNQFGQDQVALDYESFSKKRHEVKYRNKNFTEPSNVTSTVFTERLRKKILEEEEVEQRKKLEEQEKQNLQSENDHENNREINIDNKENQSQFSIWNSNVDNTNSRFNGTDHDYFDNINTVEDTAVYIENQQRLVASAKVSGKRIDNDVDMPCSKRRKLETEPKTCINKDSLPKKEDVFNRYDNEVISNISTNKFDYKEDTNTCNERNDPHCHAQYERDHSRSKSNDRYHKRREHYKKSGSDYNYTKESTYHHEKDKYNHTRSKSPILRYSDRKHKYHDDRYRDHRDKFDRKRHFHEKGEEASIISNKKCYDLRHIDKIKFNGKYNSKDFYSPRHKESKYSDSRTCRSVSHERNKSSSRERTNHKIYDKRTSSKSTKTSNSLEKHASVSLKKKDEINKLKVENILRKKDEISDEKMILEKSIKTNSMKCSESSEIVDKSIISNINVENTARESINVDNHNKLEKELVSSKPVNTINSHASMKDENSINLEYEGNKNNDQTKGAEDITVHVKTNVNTSLDPTHTLLDENKQNSTIDTITEKMSKDDEYIVQQQCATSVCDNVQSFPKDVSKNIVLIPGEVKENNTADKHNIETEELKVCNNVDVIRKNTLSNEIDKNENNILKNQHNLSKNSSESKTSSLNDLEESCMVKPQQKSEHDNNKDDHVKSKDLESKRKSSEREKSKIIVLARRRKRVQLVDTNASMTIVITDNNVNSDIDLKNNTENNLKSRACKVSRSYKNVL